MMSEATRRKRLKEFSYLYRKKTIKNLMGPTKIAKVYYVGSHEKHQKWLGPIGCEETYTPSEADIIVHLGGEDINPRLYNEADVGKYTKVNEWRDTQDTEKFIYSQDKKILSIGICRGAQFLCAKAGGRIIQDVTGHQGMHHIQTWNGKMLYMSSSHHQMLNPYVLPKEDYKVIAISSPKKSSRYLNGKDVSIIFPIGITFDEFLEPEIVYFPKINALAIQGHPEELAIGSEALVWIQNLVLDFVINKKIEWKA